MYQHADAGADSDRHREQDACSTSLPATVQSAEVLVVDSNNVVK
jgi:hypothetical protein